VIDHIIFDLDGTLIDSAGVCVELLNEMLDDRGSTRLITLKEATKLMSAGGSSMVSTLLGEECGDPVTELAEFRARYSQRVTPATCLFDGVQRGLIDLKAMGLRLAICSNKPQDLCIKVLSDVGLISLFDVIIGGAPGRAPKPAPDLMLVTLDKLDVVPEQCLFVGDSDLDYDVAKHTEVPFAFVNYGYAHPDWTIDGLDDFDCFTDLVNWIEYRSAPVMRVKTGSDRY
jgi:phosphoglycolate phosphatase